MRAESRELFKEKLGILRDELKSVQNTIDKYDDIEFKIRGWEVSLWSALLILISRLGDVSFIYMVPIIPLIFWFLDALYKTYRTNYKKRRDEIAAFLKSREFEDSFKSSRLEFATPAFPVHKMSEFVRNMFRLHIMLLHIALFAISLATLALFG